MLPTIAIIKYLWQIAINIPSFEILRPIINIYVSAFAEIVAYTESLKGCS